MLKYRVTLPGNLIESRMPMNHIRIIISAACDSLGSILYSGSIEGSSMFGMLQLAKAGPEQGSEGHDQMDKKDV